MSCARHLSTIFALFLLPYTAIRHAQSDMKQACSGNMTCLQEYMRKLAKCLLALQHDHHGGARPLLDLWVAEAIALICCVRVYNPEFLKVIDSSAMDGSQNTRLSNPLLVQHMVSAALLNVGFTSKHVCLRLCASSCVPVCVKLLFCVCGCICLQAACSRVDFSCC